ncbi:hypothetical protein [Streptomyces echinatus]
MVTRLRRLEDLLGGRLNDVGYSSIDVSYVAVVEVDVEDTTDGR